MLSRFQRERGSHAHQKHACTRARERAHTRAHRTRAHPHTSLRGRAPTAHTHPPGEPADTSLAKDRGGRRRAVGRRERRGPAAVLVGARPARHHRQDRHLPLHGPRGLGDLDGACTAASARARRRSQGGYHLDIDGLLDPSLWVGQAALPHTSRAAHSPAGASRAALPPRIRRGSLSPARRMS